MTVIMIARALVNVFSFILYAYDKFMAVRDKWRVPESVLLISTACMGAAGALLAMRMFRHKTRHLLFVILVPVMLLAQVGVMVWWRLL